ncbi:MAG: ammonium transporter [Thermoleophilia bacterium]|nr:ammonium transporter [Thermoleophilia bacterium]
MLGREKRVADRLISLKALIGFPIRLSLIVGVLVLAGVFFLGFAQPVWAEGAATQAEPGVSSADTGWMIVSTALVMLMTPGLAFFYGGLVRRKNVLSIMMQCLILMGVISIQWVLFGYSLAFGPDHGGLIGSLSWVGLRGVGSQPNTDYAATIPHQLFMLFQMMFAVITPALIIGAFAERVKFSAFVLFSLLWATIVYDPMAHWVWGLGGFLRNWGALDFAGGTVVHINAGMAALAAALVVGKRRGYPEVSPPHNLPFAVLGAALLWFGWFGFNAGSALSSGTLAVSAFLATHMAAAAAAVAWAVLDWLFSKRPTALGLISGAVAGLVAVTPAAGFVTPMGAMGIGALAGLVCYVSVVLVKPRLGYDDSLDAFGVHGVGGMLGALLTGLWATTTVNPAGADGAFHGDLKQLLVQLGALAVCAAYSFVLSFGLLKLVDKLVGLRVSADSENIGLDLTQHSESAYTVMG